MADKAAKTDETSGQQGGHKPKPSATESTIIQMREQAWMAVQILTGRIADAEKAAEDLRTEMHQQRGVAKGLDMALPPDLQRFARIIEPETAEAAPNEPDEGKQG